MPDVGAWGAGRERPEQAYRWVRRTSLAAAATVTVATGTCTSAVLRAFGADPGRPAAFDHLGDDDWVTVVDAGTAVVAVEFHGSAGARAAVLRAASASGRAASMSWSATADTLLSFAEGGRIIDAFEPMGEPAVDPALDDVLHGLDFDEYGDRYEKGLVAVERFTGHPFTRDQLDRIASADAGFRITGR
jgi:hypothetical protein